jgi:micrococcal nuclease
VGRGLGLGVCLGLGFSSYRAGQDRDTARLGHAGGGRDTLWFQPEPADRPLIAVRLRGIDAPETCQAAGPQSRAALKAEVEGRPVTLRTHGADDYRRVVGTVRRDAVDINRLLVQRGHAWAWRDARGRGPYVTDELAARTEGRGLFADPRAEPPWEFRRERGRCGR